MSFSKTDLAAISSLLALLTFSPCEAFVPVYVSGVRYGWHGFALLTIILTVATIAGMVAFTGLALTGIEQVKLRAFEKYEAGVMGALLCAVGVLTAAALMTAQPDAGGQSQPRIRIGVIVPFSGPLGFSGEAARRELGSVLKGHELLFRDDEGQPARSLAQVDELIARLQAGMSDRFIL